MDRRVGFGAKENRGKSMRVAVLLLLALLAGCVAPRAGGPPKQDDTALRTALTRHIEMLASDDFAGRQPGTEGEAKTLRYLAREWQAAGLVSGTNDPANPWFAPVELATSTPDRSAVRFHRAGRPVPLPEGAAAVFAAGARGLVERAPVVFVGDAGVQLDRSELAGRVALMLWDHAGEAEQREALLRSGAAAALAVVADRAEFDSLVAARQRGGYRLAASEPAGTLDGFVTREAAEALVGRERWAALTRAAAEPGFRPQPLDLTATLEATSAPGTVRTHNLIARLPGKRPGAGAVLLLAHWDHFGACAPPGAADTICNGAVDNASGLAMLTELARALAAGPRPERDIYFVATTAEEWGLLGAQAFAENPPIPLDTVVAAFNLDSVAIAPAGGPVAIVGKGLTPLDPGIAEVLQAMGREEGDETLAQTYVRRQDGWALLQRDVPAVAVTSAFARRELVERFNAERYHRPADEAGGIELGGAIEDFALMLALVRHFADPRRWPATAGKSAAAP
ncbi:MAG: M28 family metallopeptidase [Cypionkella sp.]